MRAFPALCFAAALAFPLFAQTTPPPKTPLPKTWIDPDTGHRIVRLTDAPNSASLYFNQHGYTADGRKLIYTTPDGISALNLETHATNRIVTGKVRVIVTSRKTQSVYYLQADKIFAADAATGASCVFAFVLVCCSVVFVFVVV